MKPVSLRFTTPLLAAFLAFAGPAMAGDVVKLKSGVKLEGVILSENANEVVIKVQVTATIADEKTVPRKDIAEVIKATPDQFEAAELAKLVPAPDEMSDIAYQKVIDEKLQPFLKKYPASRHKAEIEAIVKTYQDEMAQAKTGAKKIEGVWISSEEQVWNSYNFAARVRRVDFDRLMKEGKPELAYRILAELEINRPAAVDTVRALESFKAAIPAFDSKLDRLILEQPIKQKSRDEGVKTAAPDERKRIEEAIKEEEADLKSRIEEDRKNKIAIPAFSEYDLKSLTDAKAALQKEALRIGKLDLNAQKAAAATFQTGLKNFHEKSFLTATKNFEDAAKVFPKDSFVKERIDLSKKAAADAAKANNEANAGKPLATTPASSGTAPSGTPGADGTKAKTAEPAKTEGGAPVKKTPAPSASASAGSAGSSAEEDSAPAAEEEGSNLSLFLVGGAVLLIVLLLVVKGMAKKKAAAADE